jgi:uridine phosphorylase
MVAEGAVQLEMAQFGWMYGDAQPFCIGRFNNVEIAFIRLWIGAPAAAMTLEEVIACGAETIFEVGLSGGLQP